MNKVLLLACVFVTMNCFADELHHFSEVKSAAISGKQIHIVADLAKCNGAKNDRALNIPIGIFSPTELQAFDTRVVTSFTHFTLSNPGYPNKPVYEYVKFTISDDDNLNIVAKTLDARDYYLLRAKSFTCKLDEGAKIYY